MIFDFHRILTHECNEFRFKCVSNCNCYPNLRDCNFADTIKVNDVSLRKYVLIYNQVGTFGEKQMTFVTIARQILRMFLKQSGCSEN